MIAREKFLCIIIVILIIINLISLYKNKKESFEVKGTIENATKGGDKKIVLTDPDGNFSSISSYDVLVPSGSIIMWNGIDIPKGWVYCDGKSYDKTTGNETISSTSNDNKIITPDLRGRFIRGYDPGKSDNTIGSTGGEEQVTLSLEQIPSHTHGIYQALVGASSGWANYGDGGMQANTVNNTDSAGGKNGITQPHNNLPPFYVLVYIMKL